MRLFLAIVFGTVINQVLGVSTDDFYPYGGVTIDEALPPGDDELESRNLITTFPFFGNQLTSYHVSVY